MAGFAEITDEKHRRVLLVLQLSLLTAQEGREVRLALRRPRPSDFQGQILITQLMSQTGTRSTGNSANDRSLSGVTGAELECKNDSPAITEIVLIVRACQRLVYLEST